MVIYIGYLLLCQTLVTLNFPLRGDSQSITFLGDGELYILIEISVFYFFLLPSGLLSVLIAFLLFIIISFRLNFLQIGDTLVASGITGFGKAPFSLF